MTFLLDENLSGHTASFLRAAGHHVVRCAPRTSDREVLARAEVERALILTRDHDFLAFLPLHSGILYIQIHPSIAEDITHAVQRALTSPSVASVYGRVAILTRMGFHILPQTP